MNDLIIKDLQFQVEELEEALLEQSILTGLLFDQYDQKVDDILHNLFTRSENVDTIRLGLKDTRMIAVLERLVKHYASKGLN